MGFSDAAAAAADENEIFIEIGVPLSTNQRYFVSKKVDISSEKLYGV